MTDMNVVNLVYLSAKKAGASDFIMLALFEACIVESNFTNPQSATDHDSIGVLQQRPSAGWPNPGDVPTAVNSFVSRAKQQGQSGTAGQLAQSVQVSAFPLRYDAVKAQAATLIAQAESAAGDISGPGALDAAINKFKNLVGGGVAGAANAASGGILGEAENFFKVLTDVHTWIRFGYFVFGFGLILFGVVKLAPNTGAGNMAASAVEIGIGLVPGGGVATKLAKGAAGAAGMRRASR